MAARQLFVVLVKAFKNCKDSPQALYRRYACSVQLLSINILNRNRKNIRKRAYKIGDQQSQHSRRSVLSPVLLLPAFIFGFSLIENKTMNELPQPSVDQQDEVVLLLKRAKLKEIKQEFKESEELYHQALGLLNIYQQQKLWKRSRILQARVYIHDGMANLALARGQLEKAQNLYKETIRGALQQGMEKDDDAIIEISLKIAMIYAAQRRTDDARVGYKFCVDTQAKKMKGMKEVDSNSAALLGMAVDAYAKFLIVEKQYSEARENLEQALEIAKKSFGEVHPQIAVLMNDIATVNTLMSEYYLAKDILKVAVNIAESSNSLDLPTLYLNLGAVLMHIGEYKEARLEYMKALDIAKKNTDKIVLQKAKEALDKLDAQQKSFKANH